MTASDHKHLYSRFLNGHEGKLHFAAHSHHFWPDVTRDAHLEYWDDCAKTSDHKWEKIFGEVVPKFQTHVASILNLKHKEQIVFAPNTHELVSRLLSLFLGKPSLNILTTSSEFHSWRRQIQRISELPQVKVKSVPTDEKLIDELTRELQKKPDLFFISQVFFDSGKALTAEELKKLSDHCPEETLMVVDGYHGFAAIPTDLSELEGQIFYLGGGYKYAQAGEGAAFLVVPKGDWRPAYTGWFAEFGDLSRPSGAQVGYTRDGMSFMGATQDASGLYRFNAAWDLFHREGLTIQAIHDYVKTLQKEFIRHLPESFLTSQSLRPLYSQDLTWHGHFLTFEATTEAEAQRTEETLRTSGIIIDRRGKRLRFGFGLYQNQADVIAVIERLQKLAP